MTTSTNKKTALFDLGQILATPGAIAALGPSQVFDYLGRHQLGDWGSVCPEDKATNDEAVREGFRILSAYPINPDRPCAGYGENCVWIITESDRSVTTLLLPDEY